MTKVREVVCVGLEQLGGMRSIGRGLWASEDGHLWRIDHRVEGHNPERNAFAINGELEPVWFERPPKGPQAVEQWEV